MTLAQTYKQQFGQVSYPFEIFDANGNCTYYENGNGYWRKREFDANGIEKYFENSYGYWWKGEYDANGNVIYFEDSDGCIEGKKQSSCDGKVVEIDGQKYKLKKI